MAESHKIKEVKEGCHPAMTNQNVEFKKDMRTPLTNGNAKFPRIIPSLVSILAIIIMGWVITTIQNSDSGGKITFTLWEVFHFEYDKPQDN